MSQPPESREQSSESCAEEAWELTSNGGSEFATKQSDWPYIVENESECSQDTCYDFHVVPHELSDDASTLDGNVDLHAVVDEAQANGGSEFASEQSDWSYIAENESECSQNTDLHTAPHEFSDDTSTLDGDAVEVHVVVDEFSTGIGVTGIMITHGFTGNYSELEDGSDFSDRPPNAYPTIDASSDELEGVDDDDVCKVCYRRRVADEALSPCGHKQLCVVCITAFPTGTSCPFCRCLIEDATDQR